MNTTNTVFFDVHRCIIEGIIMYKLIQDDKNKRSIIKVDFGNSQLSENFKKELEEVREEVKKGKFTKYKNTKELAKELGL